MSKRLMSKKSEKAFSDLTGLHIKHSRIVGNALLEVLSDFEEEQKKKKLNGSPFNPI